MLQRLASAPDGATKSFTIGSYLATRLEQIGLKHHFAVAGDYNLLLLDQLLLNKNVQQVYCCNELNCAFSAEGYARAEGAAACVVTYSVGALSAFDGIAGAYAEELPVILISGSPNTNDLGSRHLLHHTLGTLASVMPAVRRNNIKPAPGPPPGNLGKSRCSLNSSFGSGLS